MKPVLPLDASAKAVLSQAREESARLCHEYVGTEHMVLALLRLTPLGAAQLLQDLGVDSAAVRTAIEAAVAHAAPDAEVSGDCGPARPGRRRDTLFLQPTVP